MCTASSGAHRFLHPPYSFLLYVEDERRAYLCPAASLHSSTMSLSCFHHVDKCHHLPYHDRKVVAFQSCIPLTCRLYVPSSPALITLISYSGRCNKKICQRVSKILPGFFEEHLPISNCNRTTHLSSSPSSCLKT